MPSQSAKPPRASPRTILGALRDELMYTDRGVLLLTMELEGRVEERTAELVEAHAELQKTNSELLQLSIELEDRVKERTAELLHANKAMEGEILQRKRSDHDLLASETRYRRLFESAKDGILILDTVTGRIVDVNPILVGLLGFSKEYFLGKKLWEIGSFKDIVASEAAFMELLAKGYLRYEDLPLETRDGRRIDVEFVSHVYLVDSTEVVQCNIRDITDRKQAAEALQQSERKLRTIFDSASDGMLLIDLETRKFLMCNSMCSTLLGFTHEEFINLDIADIHPPEDLPFIFEQIGKVMKGEHGDRSEIRFRRKDGTVFFADLGPALVMLAGRESVLLVFGDITERKRAEERIKNQLEELQRWHDVMLGREDRVQELKGEINEICRRIGETPRYPSQEAGPTDTETVEAKS